LLRRNIMMEEKLTLFIAITAAAVVLQMLILFFMYLAVRKLSARLESVVDETQSRVFPLLENAKVIQQDVKAFLETSRSKIDVILDNATQATTTVRADIERVQATVNDLLDRVRLQVIRADEMVTRTMDRVEETSEKVQHSVLSPVRKVSGIAQAISVGVGTFFANQKRRRNGGPSDEMFI
jgi:predicted PurR-regulated permease PerM